MSSPNKKITLSETRIKAAASPTPNGKKGNAIRSSIDLELQLGFEKNPLDKPSADFRDAEAWFSEAKQTAEKETKKETATANNNNSSKRPDRKSFPLWSNRTSKHADLVDDQNDVPYAPPPAADRGSFFRSSFFGGVPRSTLEQTSPLPPDRTTLKRPMGPRQQLNGGNAGLSTLPRVPTQTQQQQQQHDVQLRSIKSSQSVGGRSQNDSVKDLYDSDPAEMLNTPLWYFQLRVWINAAILLCSIIAAAIMAGVAGQPVAPNTLSSRFWIATSLISILITVTQIVFYYAKGSKMLYHYDTPFLLITSSASGTGLVKGLAKRDLYLPAVDMITHGLVVIFWIGTLSDVGTGIGGCRSSSLTLGISASVCTGLEAAVSFGVASIFGFVFTLGMKSWELYTNLGLIRKAV
ncbi:UNVERIFIED_CONTAM: hypothetical protein HDU68_011317 [Siphonaria sp. JEL0065]|nr:hypothetical protein HDU68_011317 [Siphonaria sp. JEL0065]